MSDYRPISCAQHSEYELMAMHRKVVELELFDPKERVVGTLIDITARSGAEYMILLLSDSQRKEVRLDHIKKVSSQ
ncbi:MAG: transcriptional antiterminator, Rof [Gammaproteobacteria bacterium]|nr:transcriptional antiterminator, Rof [Gammaproteobacteria bacterium]